MTVPDQVTERKDSTNLSSIEGNLKCSLQTLGKLNSQPVFVYLNFLEFHQALRRLIDEDADSYYGGVGRNHPTSESLQILANGFRLQWFSILKYLVILSIPVLVDIWER